VTDHALTEQVIGAAIEVHRALGPGLLESVYEACLCRELLHRGLPFESQVPISVVYRDVRLEHGFRIDVLVETTLLIEIKAVERLLPLHEAQILTYLRLGGFRLGLLMNFNAVRLTDGLRRFSR
jgi:GxxExxY protein